MTYFMTAMDSFDYFFIGFPFYYGCETKRLLCMTGIKNRFFSRCSCENGELKTACKNTSACFCNDTGGGHPVATGVFNGIFRRKIHH